MPLHGPAGVGRRVAGSDGGDDVWRSASRGLDLTADPHERRSEVAVDVVGQRLKRRYIKDATALAFVWRGLGHEPVETPEERGERLAAAGGRGHEGVAAARHLVPAALLHVGRLRETSAEP